MSPAFSRMLQAAEDAQLEGRLTSRDEAMEFVRSRFEPPDGIEKTI